MKSVWAIFMMLLLAVAPARIGASVPAEHPASCCSGCHCCIEENSPVPAQDVPAQPSRPVSLDSFAPLKQVPVVIPRVYGDTLPSFARALSRPFSDVPLFQRYCLFLI